MVHKLGTENSNDVNCTGMAELNNFSSTTPEAAFRIMNTQGVSHVLAIVLYQEYRIDSHHDFCLSCITACVPHAQIHQ